jgi:hypothetical protein
MVAYILNKEVHAWSRAVYYVPYMSSIYWRFEDYTAERFRIFDYLICSLNLHFEGMKFLRI